MSLGENVKILPLHGLDQVGFGHAVSLSIVGVALEDSSAWKTKTVVQGFAVMFHENAMLAWTTKTKTSWPSVNGRTLLVGPVDVHLGHAELSVGLQIDVPDDGRPSDGVQMYGTRVSVVT